jgi:hypothetical protein
MHMDRSKLEKLIKKKLAGDDTKEEESLLTSPTSLSMKNSFLIKNVGKYLNPLTYLIQVKLVQTTETQRKGEE